MKRFIALLLLLPITAYAANDTLSSNTVTQEVRCSSGVAFVSVEGGGGNDFGSGTIVLQYKHPEGDWRPLSNASWTADNTSRIEMGVDVRLRLSLTGATGPTLDWYIKCGR